MEVAEVNTKTALILAAGPIFAQKGLEGASIRAIVKVSGTNVASVNYHFGSKENLYLAVFDYVLNQVITEYVHERWSRMPLEQRTPENIREFISEVITTSFENFFMKGHPHWFYILLHREMCNPGEAFRRLKADVIDHERAAAREIFAVIKPDSAPWEADVWMKSWHALLFFNATTIKSQFLLYDWEGDTFPEDYLKQLTKSVIKMALALMD